METSTSSDDHPAVYFYYNYICKYRIPVLIIIYLVACSKPVSDSKMKSKPILKNNNDKKGTEQVAVQPKKKKKKIYLTFDDGPNKGTKNVLDIVNDKKFL